MSATKPPSRSSSPNGALRTAAPRRPPPSSPHIVVAPSRPRTPIAMNQRPRSPGGVARRPMTPAGVSSARPQTSSGMSRRRSITGIGGIDGKGEKCARKRVGPWARLTGSKLEEWKQLPHVTRSCMEYIEVYSIQWLVILVMNRNNSFAMNNNITLLAIVTIVTLALSLWYSHFNLRNLD